MRNDTEQKKEQRVLLEKFKSEIEAKAKKIAPGVTTKVKMTGKVPAATKAQRELGYRLNVKVKKTWSRAKAAKILSEKIIERDEKRKAKQCHVGRRQHFEKCLRDMASRSTSKSLNKKP